MAGPTLDFDWELGLFRAVRAMWRRVTPQAPDGSDPSGVALASIETRLRVVASIARGAPTRVIEGAVPGVRGDDVVLPHTTAVVADPEANLGLLLVQAAVLGAMVRLAPRQGPADAGDRFVANLRLGQRAESILRDELPMLGPAIDALCPLLIAGRPDGLSGRAGVANRMIVDALHGGDWSATVQALRDAKGSLDGCPPHPIWGQWMVAELTNTGEGSGEGQQPSNPTTEVEASPVSDIRVVQIDEKTQRELPMHAFEKVETLEPYNGTSTQLDGTDELDDHLEALEQVDLGVLLRGGPPASSMMKADLRLGAQIPDVQSTQPSERAVLYHEWDARRRSYRQDWCAVYPTPMPPGPQDWAAASLQTHRRLIDQIEKTLFARRSLLRSQPRQPDGDDIDVDAVVNSRASVAAGRPPDRRVYLRRRRAERDLATTLLLDVSLSVDSWVEGKRVLDVVRDSALVLGEVADRLGDRLQVLAFASHTRNRIRVWEVRGWGEAWRVGRGRLGLLAPQGYTRIGPAIRHATAELAATGARDRLLLLLSDGKPNDYDRYEGRHGIADVRRAVREASDEGVRLHAFAVDAVARDYLPAMLGPGGWSILRHPTDLVASVGGVYAQLA